MFKWKWNQNWENRIYFVLQVLIGNKMPEALKEGTSNFIGLFEVGFYDLLMLFQIVAVFIIARNWDWFGKKFYEFRQLVGWENIQEKREREKAEAEAEKNGLLGIIEKNVDFLRRRMIQPPEEHDFDAYAYGLPNEDYYQEMIRQTIYKLEKHKFSVPTKEEIASEDFDDCWRKFLTELRVRIKAGDWKDYPNLWEEFSPSNRNKSVFR